MPPPAGAVGDEARQLYTTRSRALPRPTVYRLYIFRADRVKLFDEKGFGPGIFITARIGATGDRCGKTELYQAKGEH